MNRLERKVYQFEKRLIAKFFKGLKPRPVKLVRDVDLLGRAEDPYLEINEFLLEAGKEKELEDVLKHELIHYELQDSGKEYHGHGTSFLKRAGQLGIVDSYVLERCFSFEEAQHIPHRRRAIKTPLKEIKERIDETLRELSGLILKLPNRGKIEFYRTFQNLEVDWQCFAGAVEKGEDHVLGEIWERRRGPRGKSLEELKKEHDALEAKATPLREKLGAGGTQRDWKQLAAIEGKMSKILKKAEDDYGVTL